MNHIEHAHRIHTEAVAAFLADLPRFDTRADLAASLDLLPVLSMKDFAAAVRKLLKGQPLGTALQDGDRGFFFMDGEAVLFGDEVNFEYGGDLDESAWNVGTWDGQSRFETMRVLCMPVIEQHEPRGLDNGDDFDDRDERDFDRDDADHTGPSRLHCDGYYARNDAGEWLGHM